MPIDGDLAAFWHALESHFPLAMPRRLLSERFGPQTVSCLQHAGVLAQIGQAETWPCPRPGGPECPRRIVRHSNGRITAVCGNDPPECEDIELKPGDADLIGVVPERLCEALRKPLLFGGKPEAVSGMDRVFRAGTFIPRPGCRQAVYLAARSSAEAYEGVLETLRSKHGSNGFALLIPSDRFVSEETILHSASNGIVVLPLSGLITGGGEDGFSAAADAEELFAGIGRAEPAPSAPAIFARVLTRDGWRDLDENDYRQLAGASGQYDIFIDEHSGEARRKASSRKREKPSRIKASYFRILREAVERRGYYDPNIEGLGEEQVAAKQTFQRARAAVDIKYKDGGKETWKLFKTEMVDNHSVYRFRPDPDVDFALIFLPER